MILQRWPQKDISEAVLLSGAAFLFPVTAMLAPVFVAVLFFFLAAAIVVRSRFSITWPRAISRSQAILIVGFLFWAALSITWSSASWKSASLTAMKVSADCIAGLIVVAAFQRQNASTRHRIARALAFGVMIGFFILLAIYAVERSGLVLRLEGYFSFARLFDRGATVCVILVWSALCAWKSVKWNWYAIGLVSLAFAAVGLSYSMAAKVAFCAGLVTVIVTWYFPRITPLIVGTLMASTFLAMPLVGSAIPPPDVTSQWPGLNVSAHHRLTIWRHVSVLIEQGPWTGYGLESSRVFGDKTAIKVELPGQSPSVEELLPLHPHNAALQIYLELGVIGAALAAIFLLTISNRISRSDVSHKAKAVMMATLVSAFIVAMVSYGIWQTWWLCSLWLAAAIAISTTRQAR